MIETTVGPVPLLSWHRSDPEQRCCVRGGRFTNVNGFLSFLFGLILAGTFYLALYPFEGSYLGQMFYARGVIPYCIVFLSGWSVAILLLKSLKLRLQRRALGISVVPADPRFVLTPATVDQVTDRIHEAVDDPRQFVLFNRILIALSNLRNLGRVSDVDELLRSQAENDEASVETSYHLLQGFVWAIPVLGFIGTVLGLSQAIGGFGNVLSQASDASELKPALQQVTAGLAVAFETTLQGLVAALVIQLWLTALKVSEERFLDACGEYGLRHVVGRLRLLPYETAETR
jgi:biopolymer transport protein ExbB/TolQ